MLQIILLLLFVTKWFDHVLHSGKTTWKLSYTAWITIFRAKKIKIHFPKAWERKKLNEKYQVINLFIFRFVTNFFYNELFFNSLWSRANIISKRLLPLWLGSLTHGSIHNQILHYKYWFIQIEISNWKQSSLPILTTRAEPQVNKNY